MVKQEYWPKVSVKKQLELEAYKEAELKKHIRRSQDSINSKDLDENG